MNQKQRNQINIFSAIGIVVLLVVSLVVGSVHIKIDDIFDSDSLTYQIFWEYRLPKTFTAILAGIALPASGWILQEYFRNPLAGPSVLGITSSAGLGVAFMILLASNFGFNFLISNSWATAMAGLSGALVAMLILITLANQNFSTTALIIVGFMIAAFSGALIGLLTFFADAQELKMYILWTFGSISGLNVEKLWCFFIANIIGVIIILKNIPHLVKIQLGEIYATTMGVKVKNLRLELIVAASILTGVCTALVGPIAFIGLAVPHICRTIFQTSDFYSLFIFIVLMGVGMMLLITILSVLFPGVILPINIITSLIGAPVVLHIVMKNKNL